MRRIIGIVVAVMLASCSRPPERQDTHRTFRLVKTLIVPEHRVRLGDLAGLSPSEVEQKLTDKAAGWPTAMGLEIASPEGTLGFANLREWMEDDAGHWIGRHGADRADFKPIAFSQCEPRFADPRDAPMVVGVSFENGRITKTLVKETLATGLALEFRNGHFVRAWSTPTAPRNRWTTTLEDGASFASKWARKPLAPEVALNIECWRHTSVSEIVAGPRPNAFWAGNPLTLEGLALMPFAAVELPFLNARRMRAMREGTTLYDQLVPGAEVPGGVEAFAARHSAIVVHRSPDPHYVLLQIDLGALPSRNLSYYHHEALVGVRDGRVLFRTHRGMESIPGTSPERELPKSTDGPERYLLVG